MKILHKSNSGKWAEVSKKDYKNEDELQNLLDDNINLLPFEEIGYNDQFVTIGREVGLHGNSLDLLAVSPAGHIAVIETKLNKNPEIRRTVVGQVLSYSASLWKKSYADIEEILYKYCDFKKIQRPKSLLEYLRAQLLDTEINEDEFRQGIEKRLNLGSFTLLIVVDTVGESNRELVNIADYLNDRTGQEIDFYVVEIEKVQDEGDEFLLPRLANPRRKSITASSSTNNDKYDRTPMTEEKFMSLLQSEDARKTAKKLLDTFRTSKDVSIVWVKNGFSLKTRYSSSSNFSYLLFLVGNEEMSSRIAFGYSKWHYEPINKNGDFSPIREQILEYVGYYMSLPGYNKSSTSIWNDYIDDFKVLTGLNLDKFINLINKTANNLSKIYHEGTQ